MSKDTITTRLVNLMNEKGLTIKELSQGTGMSYEMARRYYKGLSDLKGDARAKVAKWLGVSAAYLQFGEDNEDTRRWLGVIDDFEDLDTGKEIESNVGEIGGFDLWDRHTPLNEDEVAVPFYKDIRLAAGNGFADDIADYNGFKLRFSKATLRRAGVQYNQAVCLTAKGNSMEPVLPDGTTVGVNLGCKEIKDGKMYAINHGELLRIKLLQRLPNNQVRIRSYNTAEYDDEEADLQDVTILGQVFWWSFLDS
ncbi:XRE family transcriptional regulator [Testudinibacter sp. P80/BLE/0925]|uniref:XRE family transcriptional regulator n=1 Tax=Testudinibacter sp. TW-1 TaxID=3417757 RepID=UPI003D369DF1